MAVENVVVKVLDKLVDLLKLSPRYLFMPLLLITAFGLFAPANWLDFLGVASFASQSRAYIGVTFVVSAAFILVSVIHWIFSLAWGIIADKRRSNQRLAKKIERLHSLTEDEKDLLRGYIAAGTRTQYFPFGDGVVRGLEVAGIISIPGGNMMGSLLTGVAYNIQSWAWDYLHEHPKILQSSRSPGERPYKPRHLHQR